MTLDQILSDLEIEIVAAIQTWLTNRAATDAIARLEEGYARHAEWRAGQ